MAYITIVNNSEKYIEMLKQNMKFILNIVILKNLTI